MLAAVVVGLTGASATNETDVGGQPAATAAPIPDEVRAGWERQIGTWVADNSAYRSEDDPHDAFSIEWRWGIGQTSVVGRLYGIQGGRDIATYWEFREYWHPGERRLVPMQFGADGAVGIGTRELQAGGRSEMLQTLFHPATGVIERIGHRSELSGDTHVTRSFNVSADGTRTDRRTYTWVRQPGGRREPRRP